MGDNKVAILIKKASLVFDKLSNNFFCTYDLTTSQYKILKYLYAQPKRVCRIVDLERYYSMTHPTAIGLLDQLEKKGFIVRIPNPDDARGKLISLTPKADAMEDDLIRLGLEVDNQLTRNLSEEEKQQLVHLLQKLLEI